MLHEFVSAKRAVLIARCGVLLAGRLTPEPTELERARGVPLFLDQLVDALQLEPGPGASGPNHAILYSATTHSSDLLHGGLTIGEIVSHYASICATITGLALELHYPISAADLRTLYRCLDDATAAAATEYTRLREYEGTERLGRLAHELRNQLNNAVLSHDMLKRGLVGSQGSTSAVLTRSLLGLQNLVDRELADVRLGAGIYYREVVVLQDLIGELEATAAMEAAARGLGLSVTPVAADVVVRADRQILASMVGNLLQNAFKFTRPKGHIALRVQASDTRVLIDIEDQCGGLPTGRADKLFRSFERGGADRSGLGLGLSICARGARINDGAIRVVDRPGTGCVFTVDLPRQSEQSGS